MLQSTSQAIHLTTSVALQIPITGRLTRPAYASAQSRSKPRNFSQSVTAASYASSSTLARLR